MHHNSRKNDPFTPQSHLDHLFTMKHTVSAYFGKGQGFYTKHLFENDDLTHKSYYEYW